MNYNSKAYANKHRKPYTYIPKKKLQYVGEIFLFVSLEGEYCYAKEYPKEGIWTRLEAFKQFRNI